MSVKGPFSGGKGPYNGRWHKNQSLGKPRFQSKTLQPIGRRLMPAELAKAVAAMAMPVSKDRYRPETEKRRAERANAYQDGVAFHNKLYIKPVKPVSAVFDTSRGRVVTKYAKGDND